MPRSSFGQIYQRPDSPRWYIKIPTGVNTTSGRTAYRVKAVGTEAQARAVLEDLQRQHILMGLRPKPREVEEIEKLTLAEAVEQYIESGQRKPATVEAYKRALSRLRESSLGRQSVKHVTAKAIEAYLTGISGAPATVRGHLMVISGALSRLVRLDLLDRNPAMRVKPLKVKSQPRAVLTRAEVGKLLAACSGSRARDQLNALVVAGLLTGARLGELLDLTWDDLDFERGVLSIQQEKTGTVTTVPLHGDLADGLKAHRSRLGRVPIAEGRVFGPMRGGPKRWRADKLMVETFEAAGIRRAGMCFHALRNTFATRYLEAGGNPRNLQRLLGHSQLRTTEIYARSVDEQTATEVRSLDVGLTSGRKHQHTRSTPAGRKATKKRRREVS